MFGLTLPELFLHASVWLALTAWASGEALRSVQPVPSRAARIVWGLGAFSLAVHIALAFQLRHQWSHAAAVADTARQTAERFGVKQGDGVWFNYLLLAWWLTDATRAWFDPVRWNRPSLPRLAQRAFFFFMWFSGAVLFPVGAIRWLGSGACLVVVAAWLRSWHRK